MRAGCDVGALTRVVAVCGSRLLGGGASYAGAAIKARFRGDDSLLDGISFVMKSLTRIYRFIGELPHESC